jgi:hypothetical protein
MGIHAKQGGNRLNIVTVIPGEAETVGKVTS